MKTRATTRLPEIDFVGRKSRQVREPLRVRDGYEQSQGFNQKAQRSPAAAAALELLPTSDLPIDTIA